MTVMTLLHRPEPALHPDAPPLQLRVAAHDQSRVEWICTVPMAPAGHTHTYQLTMEFEVPDAIWVPHDPWQRYQVRTRLTSPVLRHEGPDPLASDPRDRLRLRALSVVHALRLGGRKVCKPMLEAQHRDGILRDDEATRVVAALSIALQPAHDHRRWLAQFADHADASLQRESRLADEYVSGHVLLLLTRARAALQTPNARRPSLLSGTTDEVMAALAAALTAEQAYRRATQMHQPAPQSPADIEAYVNRAAQLKKHFQQALFLDVTAFMLDERLRNWIAAAMAMVAAVFYFAWQVSVLNAVSAGATTVSLALAALVGALVYAAKDRIKEVGRSWLAEQLKHTYADRVARLRLQERMDPERREFVLALETITVRRSVEPDRFNPELGRTTPVHRVFIRERLRHTGVAQLHQHGLLGLKHVFRYDLSPLLAKLDDHQKHVPVLGPHGVTLRSGSRVYVLPVTARLTRLDGNGEQELLCQRGHLLLRGRRLVRFLPQGLHSHPAVASAPKVAATAESGPKHEAVAR
jgi:hypothetical protein